MPIAVRDYTWEETETQVFITVPLKGVKAHKVDIFSTNEYIKVNYPPYFFECLLYATVDDRASVAQVGSGAVVFKLNKTATQLWNQLQSPDASDKQKLRERKEAAVEYAQKQNEEDKKEKAVKKREADKYAINQQLKIEQEERERIENLKESERKQATEDLERWKLEQTMPKLTVSETTIDEQNVRQEKSPEINNQPELREENHNESSFNKSTGKPAGIFEAAPGAVRESGKIEVAFTPRVFPTAARESTAPDEEEWLRKQSAAQRVQELENKDLSEEEKNPLWLRDKGNDFFKAGNYQAAINAYSHAVRLNYKMHSLYSNRAACHMKLRNFIKCVEDSSRALDLLTPPVPQNAASRLKAHVRRGTAFCELELYAEGLQDYEAALKIEPQNEQLKDDAVRIRRVIQGETLSGD